MNAERPRADVPEADALEQAQDVVDEPGAEQPSTAYDAPEADAIEQSQDAPLDDEDDR